ncbi:MAG: 2-amino-4-hydroxy-6-hydroxymethyldihydropteridine diphosphokinase [Phycisphaerae bacterium]|nr:MAG: 2-amino-4-hydroxy-6-hydroxymethyldihydropteridine diphosphokinase [Phycisphaerae bacterium]
MVEPVPAAIALGSNLGDRRAAIHYALAALRRTPGVDVVSVSSFHETAPVGGVPQGPYLNAAASLETAMPPRDLLAALHAIERSFGRDRAREQRWGPRTLDLDLILYADAVINEPGLTVPHPRAHERLFVLDPLAEVAPDLVFPTLGRTVRDLRDALRPRD